MYDQLLAFQVETRTFPVRPFDYIGLGVKPAPPTRRDTSNLQAPAGILRYLPDLAHDFTSVK
jgi:hypothetical protein